MFTIANQSIIDIQSDTDLQNAKNVKKFEFRGHGLRIHLKKSTNDPPPPTVGQRIISLLLIKTTPVSLFARIHSICYLSSREKWKQWREAIFYDRETINHPHQI